MKVFVRAPEIDISELESLFSAASASDGTNKGGVRRGANINKPEKVQLVSYSSLAQLFYHLLLKSLYVICMIVNLKYSIMVIWNHSGIKMTIKTY